MLFGVLPDSNISVISQAERVKRNLERLFLIFSSVLSGKNKVAGWCGSRLFKFLLLLLPLAAEVGAFSRFLVRWYAFFLACGVAHAQLDLRLLMGFILPSWQLLFSLAFLRLLQAFRLPF